MRSSAAPFPTYPQLDSELRRIEGGRLAHIPTLLAARNLLWGNHGEPAELLLAEALCAREYGGSTVDIGTVSNLAVVLHHDTFAARLSRWLIDSGQEVFWRQAAITAIEAAGTVGAAQRTAVHSLLDDDFDGTLAGVLTLTRRHDC